MFSGSSSTHTHTHLVVDRDLHSRSLICFSAYQIHTQHHIFANKWEATHNQIDRRSEDVRLLQAQVVDLEGLLGLQQTTLQHCQDMIAGLEETIAQLVASVKKLEKMVCQCHDQLLSLGPHYAPGEEEEMVEEMEEEEEED